INRNNIRHVLGNLLRRYYASSQDYELIDQLFQPVDQLLNVSELQVDNVVALDIIPHYDDDGEYQEQT
ncbi:unnamed protein product, partial [Rotaria sp. Silwood2]